MREQHAGLLAIPDAPDQLKEFRAHPGLFEALTAWRASNRTSNQAVEEDLNRALTINPDTRVKLVELAKELDELLGQQNVLRSMRGGGKLSWLICKTVINIDLITVRADSRKLSDSTPR